MNTLAVCKVRELLSSVNYAISNYARSIVLFNSFLFRLILRSRLKIWSGYTTQTSISFSRGVTVDLTARGLTEILSGISTCNRCVCLNGRKTCDRRIRATMKDQFPGNRTSSRFPLGSSLYCFISRVRRKFPGCVEAKQFGFFSSPLTSLTSLKRRFPRIFVRSLLRNGWTMYLFVRVCSTNKFHQLIETTHARSEKRVFNNGV